MQMVVYRLSVEQPAVFSKHHVILSGDAEYRGIQSGVRRNQMLAESKVAGNVVSGLLEHLRVERAVLPG